MKKFAKEFKEFISKGSFIDMAVGIVVGGAFTAIVNTFVSAVITPLINWIIFLVSGGNTEVFGGLSITLIPATVDATTGLVTKAATVLDFSALISAILNFLLTALVLFTLLKAVNKMRRKAEQLKEKVVNKIENKEETPIEEQKVE